jgi:hypothetical protein
MGFPTKFSEGVIMFKMPKDIKEMQHFEIEIITGHPLSKIDRLKILISLIDKLPLSSRKMLLKKVYKTLRRECG